MRLRCANTISIFCAVPRSVAFPRLRDLAGHIASTFVDRARHFSGRTIRTTPRLESASSTVVLARAVEHRRIIIHERARRGQRLAARADVDIVLVVISEIVA